MSDQTTDQSPLQPARREDWEASLRGFLVDADLAVTDLAPPPTGQAKVRRVKASTAA